ncbi:DNA-binding protein WhiA [Buchananella felis]|uniref:DNA-binding protein WhiA n=1 Tax=Buchananella felis TaxID=3231492 RepID=UPI003529C453
MSMTVEVKDELARVQVERPGEMRAEVAALVRFSGGLQISGGTVVLAPELDSGVAARRLRQALRDLYDVDSEMIVINGGLRKGNRYVVRVVTKGADLARTTGLIDRHGRPVRGLPPRVVAGTTTEAIAALRGAFLARGSLTEPGRSGALEITCPGGESALAIVGLARRVGVSAKAREARGGDRVVIRDGDHIATLLTLMGAKDAVHRWEERRSTREARGHANRLQNFDDANLRRSTQAAVTAGARVGRAFEILGGDVPAHLVEAGRLRMEHPEASLEELGRLTVPPLTKDAVAGRIRRLLAMADKRADELGIPGTTAAIPPEGQDH